MSTALRPDELRASLKGYTGSDSFTRWSPLFPRDVLTQGAEWLAEQGGCYWLMDAIASHQRDVRLRGQDFQAWFLRQRPKDWHLYCEDGNEKVLIEQSIEWSDFPLPEGITLWACANEFGGITIMLPTEY